MSLEALVSETRSAEGGGTGPPCTGGGGGIPGFACGRIAARVRRRLFRGVQQRRGVVGIFRLEWVLAAARLTRLGNGSVDAVSGISRLVQKYPSFVGKFSSGSQRTPLHGHEY